MRRIVAPVMVTLLLGGCTQGQDNPKDPARTPVKVQSIDEYDSIQTRVQSITDTAARAAAQATGGRLSDRQDLLGDACNDYTTNGRSIERNYSLSLRDGAEPTKALQDINDAWRQTTWPAATTFRGSKRGGSVRIDNGPAVTLSTQQPDSVDVGLVVVVGTSTCLQVNDDVRDDLELRDLRETNAPEAQP